MHAEQFCIATNGGNLRDKEYKSLVDRLKPEDGNQTILEAETYLVAFLGDATANRLNQGQFVFGLQ